MHWAVDCGSDQPRGGRQGSQIVAWGVVQTPAENRRFVNNFPYSPLKRLTYIGGFNSVTFICSKTDDISLEEAQDSLGLSDEMEPDWEELEKLVKKTKSMKKQMDEMKDTKAVYGESMNDIDEQIELWDGLKEKLENGETVFPPKAKSAGKKRKYNSNNKARKRQRKTKSSDDESDNPEDSDVSDNSDEENKGSEDDLEGQEPLTEEQIVAKLQELRATKKEARAQRGEITERITELRKEIDECKIAEDRIESKMSAMCISGRNAYSKGAIQQDFAAGIKELDQELAAEEDEENFNPDAEIRDYDEVARGLPVFCVSSRGYRKAPFRVSPLLFTPSNKFPHVVILTRKCARKAARSPEKGPSHSRLFEHRRDGDPSIASPLRKAHGDGPIS